MSVREKPYSQDSDATSPAGPRVRASDSPLWGSTSKNTGFTSRSSAFTPTGTSTGKRTWSMLPPPVREHWFMSRAAKKVNSADFT